MQESTRSKLIVFSRLWAIPMFIFIVLSITVVIVGMDNRKNLMNLAVIGMGLMFVIQICQLVAAIIVRHRWLVCGSIVGLLASVFVMIWSIAASGAEQCRPPMIHPDDTDSTEVVPVDSAYFFEEGKQLSCKISAIIPEAAVRQTVGEWLNSYLGECYTGDMSDIQALVDFYGKYHVDSLRRIYEEGVPDFAELCYDVSMAKIYESDKVVTYSMMIYVDLGGAHPTTESIGATFCKDDGRQLKWDIVRNECMADLQDVMRQMLKDYFEVKTDDELMEYLQEVDDVKHIPLPVTPPYMTEKGFTFIYQQYEIAAYAVGMPGDTISYRRFKPYLTEWAKRLLPEND